MMSDFITTLILASIVMGLLIMGLAIGLLLTGKTMLKRGTCGHDPTKKADDSCGKKKTCPYCSPEEKSADAKEGNPDDSAPKDN